MTSTTMANLKMSQAMDYRAFVTIFRVSVWVIFFALMAATGFAFAFMWSADIDDLSRRSDGSSWTSILAVVGLVMLQKDPSHLTFRSITGKLLLVLSGFCAFVMYSYYSADLTSQMTVGAPSLKIESFADILELGINVFVWKDSTPALHMSKAEEGTAQAEVRDVPRKTK